MRMEPRFRVNSFFDEIGAQKSGTRGSMPVKPGAATPMTVKRLPDSSIVLPTICGSLLKMRCHAESLRTATGGAEAVASSGRIGLPNAVPAPSVAK